MAKTPKLISKDEARRKLRELRPLAIINYIESGFTSGALTQEMVKSEIDDLLKNPFSNGDVKRRCQDLLDRIRQMNN